MWSTRGVIIIKCAGQNSFKTLHNHLKTTTPYNSYEEVRDSSPRRSGLPKARLNNWWRAHMGGKVCHRAKYILLLKLSKTKNLPKWRKGLPVLCLLLWPPFIYIHFFWRQKGPDCHPRNCLCNRKTTQSKFRWRQRVSRWFDNLPTGRILLQSEVGASWPLFVPVHSFWTSL
jgi:hypothetical protein